METPILRLRLVVLTLLARQAATEPEIVSVTIDKVLTLDSTSFKAEVVLSLQSHGAVRSRMHLAKAVKYNPPSLPLPLSLLPTILPSLYDLKKEESIIGTPFYR